MSMRTLSILVERFKSQGRRRRKMEVLCSGVPLGSLAGFWDGCRLWEINSVVWNPKKLKRDSFWIWFDFTQDCGQPSYVIVYGMWCQWWSIAFLTLTTFGLCLPTQSKDEQDWTGIVILGNICRTFGNKLQLAVQFQFFNIFRPAQSQLESGYQVLPPRRRWDLCSAKLHQFRRRDSNLSVVIGGKWRCRAQVFPLGLWHDFEMAVGSGRSTLGSEIEKKWRDIIEMFVFVPSPDLSREHGGCLRLSLFLSMNWRREHGDCLSLSMFPRMILILTQGSRQSSYVIVHGMWCQWWSIAFLTLTTFGLCLPTQSKDEQDWTGLFILGNMWRTLCNSDQHSDSWNLDTKFFLHAAGGIYVHGNCTNWGGKIQISGSSAKKHGGAVLMSFSWVFGEMFMICHQCSRQSLIANWLMSWCLVAVAFAPYFRREQGGSFKCLCISEFLFDLNQGSGQSSYVIVHDMWR